MTTRHPGSVEFDHNPKKKKAENLPTEDENKAGESTSERDPGDSSAASATEELEDLGSSDSQPAHHVHREHGGKKSA